MLELKPLTYFIAAYEENSISAAAIRCFIAQPSISHAIKNLEIKLDKTLFIRNKSGLTPTEHGHELYQHAKQLISHAQSIEESLTNTPKIDINIYFQGDIALTPLQSIIGQLTHVPHVHLHRVSELNQADIAFLDSNKVGKRFQGYPLFKENFSLLINEKHPLANKPLIALEDIQQDHFIERPYCSMRTEFLQLIKEMDIQLNIASQADNDLQVMELITLGFGISALPTYRSMHIPKGIVCKPVDLDFKREVVMAVRSSRKDIQPIIKQLTWQPTL